MMNKMFENLNSGLKKSIDEHEVQAAALFKPEVKIEETKPAMKAKNGEVKEIKVGYAKQLRKANKKAIASLVELYKKIAEEVKEDNNVNKVSNINSAFEKISEASKKNGAAIIINPSKVVAGIERVVACVKTNNLIVGLIGTEDKFKGFTWKIDTDMYPSIDGIVIPAKQGVVLRALIQKRFGTEGIIINPIMPEKKDRVKYKSFKTASLCFNMFENGYVRGIHNGTPFVWNMFKYSRASIVSKAGFGGKLLGTSKDISEAVVAITSRVGIVDKKSYIEFINSNKRFTVREIEMCLTPEEVKQVDLAMKLNKIIKASDKKKLDKTNREHVGAYNYLVKAGFHFDSKVCKIISPSISEKVKNFRGAVKNAA